MVSVFVARKGGERGKGRDRQTEREREREVQEQRIKLRNNTEVIEGADTSKLSAS